MRDREETALNLLDPAGILSDHSPDALDDPQSARRADRMRRPSRLDLAASHAAHQRWMATAPIAVGDLVWLRGRPDVGIVEDILHGRYGSAYRVAWERPGGLTETIDYSREAIRPAE